MAFGRIALECGRRVGLLSINGTIRAQMGSQVRSPPGHPSCPCFRRLTQRTSTHPHRYKPMQLRVPLFLHSLAMALLNAHIFLELFTASRALGYSYSCQPCRVSYSPHEMRVSRWQKKAKIRVKPLKTLAENPFFIFNFKKL